MLWGDDSFHTIRSPFRRHNKTTNTRQKSCERSFRIQELKLLCRSTLQRVYKQLPATNNGAKGSLHWIFIGHVWFNLTHCVDYICFILIRIYFTFLLFNDFSFLVSFTAGEKLTIYVLCETTPACCTITVKWTNLVLVNSKFYQKIYCKSLSCFKKILWQQCTSCLFGQKVRVWIKLEEKLELVKTPEIGWKLVRLVFGASLGSSVMVYTV